MSTTAHTLFSRVLLHMVSLCVWGCGSPSDRILARDPGQSEQPATTARGRVRVVNGRVVTDRDTPLRGVTIPLDTEPDFAVDAALFASLSHEAGLNAVHIYAENWEVPTGSNQAPLDRAIDLAESTGLYVIIAIGGGHAADGHPGNGWFDIATVRSFWEHYAPRYRDRTHVLYEIQNNPELVCDVALNAATMSMEKEAYALIRGVAPDTHVLLMSYASTPTASALTAAIDELGTDVDWSLASIGTHANPTCVLPEAFEEARLSATSRGVALLPTELPIDDFVPYVTALEAADTGWMSQSWLTRTADLQSFRQENEQAGISWCPDYGIWPEDAATCQTP